MEDEDKELLSNEDDNRSPIKFINQISIEDINKIK